MRNEPAPQPTLTPFLKWAGGKRWFVHQHPQLFPKSYRRYVEPFLGSGAVYFYLKPKDALLGDVNPEVVETYKAIKEDWRNVKRNLAKHHQAHAEIEGYYYDVREKSPRTLASRAARTIYLNRTCFNGIYRVNKQGVFNVPRGTKDTVVMESDDFESMADLLSGAKLRIGDFEKLIDDTREDDFLFADPPYTVRHNLNGFIKYNEVLFSWDDQERLAKAIRRAAWRGVKVISTNANHDSVRALYSGMDFLTRAVSRFSQISADGSSRRQFEELIITSNI